MDRMGQRLLAARENSGFSQEEARTLLGISRETLADWESGRTTPSIEQIPLISDVYGITTDWLLTGTLPSAKVLHVTEHLSNRLFDENKMYTYIGAYANAKNFYQTKRSLSFAMEKHRGQFRKEREGEKVPYIYHPLLMTCHALALGFLDDDILSTALLHDVCEDCGVKPEELPVNDTVKEAVRCLTKPEDFQKTEEDLRTYYDKIADNRIASVVKLLDRCQNVSGMASCYGDDRMAAYIMETENYLYPIYRKIRNLYPEYSDQMFLIKYHMSSVIETLRHYMKAKM